MSATEIDGDEFVVCSQYTRSNDPVTLYHTICKQELVVEANSFLQGNSYCSVCYGNKRKEHKNFLIEFYSIHSPGEYDVLTEYINNSTYVKIRHNICEKTWSAVPNALLSRKSRCGNCYGNKKITKHEFNDLLFEKRRDKYKLVGGFIHMKKKETSLHKICGRPWDTYPWDLLNGVNCRHCSLESRTKSDEQFKKELYLLVNNEYIPLESYKGASEKILMEHTKCGYQWNISPSYFFTRGVRCPSCNESGGERKDRLAIESLLSSITYKITYKREVRFAECTNEGPPLPFDFGIYNENNDLLGLIEYDGIQNFEPTGGFSTKKKFMKFNFVINKKTIFVQSMI